MEKLMAVLTVLVAGIVVIFALSLILAAPTMWLWNGCAVDAVPALRPIGFWQAMGLNILCGLLFKSSHTSNSKP